MKKLQCFLVMSAFVLPVLIPSKASAFGGPGYGFQDRERYRGAQDASRGHLDAEQTYLQRFETARGNRFVNNDDPAGTPVVAPPNIPGGGENAPIDGGISLLLAAGLGLGVKKAMGKNKAAKQDNNETAG